MRTWVAVLVGGTMLWGAAAIAQDLRTNCGGVPQRVEGRVAKVDLGRGRLVLQEANGTSHEFNASRETLEDLKIGDRIEATLRSAPNCK